MVESAITPDENQPTESGTRRIITPALILFLTIAVPVLLTLISVRIVMTTAFLEFEYNRPGFPEDIYGFTTEDRLEYAPYAINYLLNGEDISYLGDLTFPNGAPLYNSRELRHMEDVKVVTRAAYFLLFWGSVATAGIITVMTIKRDFRPHLRQGLFNGGLLTVFIIVTIIAVALVAWDFFFDTFHNIFFESGTWRFAYSDTLIRLFPETLWFDAAITIGLLTSFGATLILFLTWQWGKRDIS